jgi:hypothetical protein
MKSVRSKTRLHLTRKFMTISRWITSAVAAVASALLPACDNVALQEIKPGISTAAEVRARLGNPGNEFPNLDGSITWEYTRQPQGVDCYMITLSRDQIVMSMEQVLTDANYAQAREGMSEAEILRLLGTPASKVVYNNLQENIWEWRIRGTPASEETYFNAHFDLSSGLLKKAGKRVAQRG